MKEIRTDYTFLEPYDPNMPKWTQVDKARKIYAAYKCSNCGHIVEEFPSNDVCPKCREVGDFNEIEVDENLKEIEEV